MWSRWLLVSWTTYECDRYGLSRRWSSFKLAAPPKAMLFVSSEWVERPAVSTRVCSEQVLKCPTRPNKPRNLRGHAKVLLISGVWLVWCYASLCVQGRYFLHCACTKNHDGLIAIRLYIRL